MADSRQSVAALVESWQQASPNARRLQRCQQVGPVTPRIVLLPSASWRQGRFSPQQSPRIPPDILRICGILVSCRQVFLQTSPAPVTRCTFHAIRTAQPAAPSARGLSSRTGATPSTTQQRCIEVPVEVCTSAASADAPKEAEIRSTPLAFLDSSISSTSLSSGMEATSSTTQRRCIEIPTEGCAYAASADAPKEAEIPSTPLASLCSTRNLSRVSSVVSILEEHKGGSEASHDTSASSLFVDPGSERSSNDASDERQEPSEVALYEKLSSRGVTNLPSLVSILEELKVGSEASQDTSVSSLLVDPGSFGRSNGASDEGPEPQAVCANPPDVYCLERVPGAMEPQIVELDALSSVEYEEEYFPTNVWEHCD